MNNQLLDSLSTVSHKLNQIDVKWCLIGGLAVSIYTDPRFTRDIDLVVSVENDREAEALTRKWRSFGYHVEAVVEQEHKNRLATVRSSSDETNIIVDFLFASSGIESEIVRDAQLIEIVPDLEIPVATPAAIVALKLLSKDANKRPMDSQDLNQLSPLLTQCDWEKTGDFVTKIEERGFARGRDLKSELKKLKQDTESP